MKRKLKNKKKTGSDGRDLISEQVAAGRRRKKKTRGFTFRFAPAFGDNRTIHPSLWFDPVRLPAEIC